MEPAVGRVLRRRLGGTAARRIKSARRSRASSRFCAWVRCRRASITTTPSVVTRLPASASSRSRTSGASAADRFASNRSCTAVATLFTFCPPGPDARTNRSSISESSITIASVTRKQIHLPPWAERSIPTRKTGRIVRAGGVAGARSISCHVGIGSCIEEDAIVHVHASIVCRLHVRVRKEVTDRSEWARPILTQAVLERQLAKRGRRAPDAAAAGLGFNLCAAVGLVLRDVWPDHEENGLAEPQLLAIRIQTIAADCMTEDSSERIDPLDIQLNRDLALIRAEAVEAGCARTWPRVPACRRQVQRHRC